MTVFEKSRTTPFRDFSEAVKQNLFWVTLVMLVVAVTYLATYFPVLAEVPKGILLPVSGWINTAMSWFISTTQPLFRALSWVLTKPMGAVQFILLGLPWLTVATALVLLAWVAAGWRLAVFAGLGCLVTLQLGYWTEAMNTLSLVGVSVPLALATGFALGMAGFIWPRIRQGLEIMLDLMQTMPAFAYLIPILLLFGFGPVVGLIASAIYAAPPMVRNSMLGLQRVPDAQIESGQMAGCTPWQLFWQVRIPGAMPQILVGLNQTTMQALSMVIIAAIIGGFDDIGWSVLSSLRKAQFGQSLMAGLIIVFLAILIDRITWGFAQKARNRRIHIDYSKRMNMRIGALVVLLVASLLGSVVPALNYVPSSSVLSIAEPLNAGLETFLFNYGPALAEIKNAAFFYMLLPLRIGLENSVTPFTWGMELTGSFIVGYWFLIAVACLALSRLSLAASGAALFFGWIFYFGFLGVSWLAFSGFVVALAYFLGGTKSAIKAALCCVFLVVSGLWDKAMLSLYLCGTAVVISLIWGGMIGIIAAHSDRVSAVSRVIADTLQTMPQFVLLIPFLMIFQVGEFTALLAIIIYAVVPAMRYVELGLRGVNPTVIEAAEQIGCNRFQILMQVRFPLAAPVLALGVNQTIMFGLAMLAITALVGTQDLGQEVYVALAQADAGRGLSAGFGIAIIAFLSDRMIRDWIKVLSKHRHLATGNSDTEAQPPI